MSTAMVGRVLTLAVLGGLLAFAIWTAVYMWTSLDNDIPPAGWIALALGILFSFVVGSGLMAMVFISARRGYDERAGHRMGGSAVDDRRAGARLRH